MKRLKLSGRPQNPRNNIMATKLLKPRKMQFEHSYEGRPVIVTINPDLTAEIALKGLPSTKFLVNLLEAFVASKKVGGVNSVRKTFAIEGKQIVLVPRPAKAPKAGPTEEVISDCACRIPDDVSTGPVSELLNLG